MNISGEAAKSFKVVRIDSYSDAIHPRAELLEADDTTGLIKFKDHVTGEEKQVMLQPHVMRIVPR